MCSVSLASRANSSLDIGFRVRVGHLLLNLAWGLGLGC